MADQDTGVAQEKPAAGKGPDEIALELMKFIATETGYARGQQAVGFTGKSARTPDEQAEALLDLFARCRKAVAER
jgi:hypothetical protein